MEWIVEALKGAQNEIIGGIVVALILGVIGIFRKWNRPKPSLRLPRFNRGVKFFNNHLLIEKGVDFNDEFRKRILKNKNELGITVDHFEDSKGISYYKTGWQQFINDSNSKWLFTIYPEERDVRITQDEENHLLSEMEKENKIMICIESGHRLQKKSDAVVVITTNHEKAMRDLIRTLSQSILNKHQKVHFVILPGPKNNSSADQRRVVQVEYLARLLLQHNVRETPRDWFDKGNFQYWGEVLSYTDQTNVLRISILPESSWYRIEGKELVLTQIEDLDILQDAVHTCFLCGNDDLALGALDAINEWGAELNIKPSELNISFFGFDGLEEMVKILQNGTCGGTMKVQYDSICEKINSIYKNNTILKNKVVQIDAHRIASS